MDWARDAWLHVLFGYELAVHRLDTALHDAFERLGVLVVRRTFAVILVTLLISGGFSLGLLHASTMDDSARLWTPQNTDVWDHVETVAYNFPNSAFLRTNELILVPRDGSSAIAKVILEQLAAFQNALRGNPAMPFRQACAPVGDTTPCVEDDLFQLWVAPELALERSDAEIAAAVFAEDARLAPRHGGTPFQRHLMVSATGDDVAAHHARAVRWVFYTTDTNEARRLEQVFLDQASAWAWEGVDVAYVAARSLGDELEAVAQSDVALLLLGYLLMLALLFVMLSRTQPLFRTRILLSLVGIVSIALSITAGFGLAALAGTNYSALTAVLPYLLMGLSIDDIIILVDQVSKNNRKLPMEVRVSAGFAHAGKTITMTTVTDIAAFAMGTASNIPAIRDFCVYACCAVFFTFFMQVTFFGAVLVLDERRMTDHRWDVFPWRFYAKKPSHLELAQGESPGDPLRDGLSHTRVSRWMDETYAKVITEKPMVRVVVIALFFALFAVNVWGTVELDTGLPLVDLTRIDSHYRDFDDAKTTFFAGAGEPISAYTWEAAYHTLPVQRTLVQLTYDLRANEYLASSGPPTWWESFIAFTASDPLFGHMVVVEEVTMSDGTVVEEKFFPVETDVFAQRLHWWISLPHHRDYGRSLVLNDGFESTPHALGSTECIIKAQRLELPTVGVLESSSDRIALMDETRAIVEDEAWALLGPNRFPVAVGFVYYEADKIIDDELTSSLISTTVIIFVVCVALLQSFSASCLLTLVVCMINVDLVGSLFVLWDHPINVLTVVALLMSVGLVVDFSAHIVHSFVRFSVGTRQERVAHALEDMAHNVIAGAFTTFVGAIPLAFSSSTIFRIFFHVFVSVVLFGVLHGIILMPCLLMLTDTDSALIAHHAMLLAHKRRFFHEQLGTDHEEDKHLQTLAEGYVSEEDEHLGEFCETTEQDATEPTDGSASPAPKALGVASFEVDEGEGEEAASTDEVAVARAAAVHDRTAKGWGSVRTSFRLQKKPTMRDVVIAAAARANIKIKVGHIAMQIDAEKPMARATRRDLGRHVVEQNLKHRKTKAAQKRARRNSRQEGGEGLEMFAALRNRRRSAPAADHAHSRAAADARAVAAAYV